MHRGLRLAAVILICLGQCAACPGKADVATFRLSGRVSGGSGNHAVYVALWDAEGFLVKPVREVRIAPGQPREFDFEVPAGPWALSAYEDENGNGKLDMGLFGPKESSGFWRPFHGWHKPRFDEVAVAIDRDRGDLEIRLGK